MNKTERRQNKRVPAKFKINYIHEGDYLISFTRDISVDGMFIYTENPPSVGEQTKLTFSLEDSDPIAVEAKVIWANTSGNKKDHGVGVQFINSSQEFKDAILAYVNRVAIIEENDVS